MERNDQVRFYWDEVDSCENGGTFHVTLEIPTSVGWIDFCKLVLEDGSSTSEIPLTFLKLEKDRAIFEATLFLNQRAAYRYYFRYRVGHQDYFINRFDTKTQISYDEKNKLGVHFSTPDWAKGATMYHIFVDRFYRGNPKSPTPQFRRYIHPTWDEDVVLGDNYHVVKHYDGEPVWNVDFYGGDLLGITKKLDYLKSLGVDILYLSPIVASQSNHRYDTADYENVDPYVGCNDDLKNLCLEAHKRGMRVVVDAVFNHVGDESKYFDRYGDYKSSSLKDRGVFQNPQSKYHDFFRYHWKDGREENSFWWGFPTLPELNCDGEFWRNYICGEGGILDQWFSLGIDGVRLDVADNLSDDALEEIHKAVLRNKKDGFILGEVWDNPMRNGRSYISSGKSMHSVMNYPLTDALVRYFKYQDDHKLEYVIRDTQAEYPEEVIPTLMNFTSTHDISRAITLLGKKQFDGKDAFKSLEDSLKSKVYEALWEIGYTNEDILGLFYGSVEIDYYDYQRLMEILKNKGVSSENLQLLTSILSFSPFDKHQVWAKDLPEDIKKDLDYTRFYTLTEDEYQKAKCVYQAYLFFLATYPGIFSIFYGDEVGMQGLNNLANRRPFPWGREDKNLQEYVKMLGQFRKKYPFLKDAGFRLLDITPKEVSFERMGEKEKLFVSLNNTEDVRDVKVPSSYEKGEEVLTLRKSYSNRLGPYGGVAIRKELDS